MKKIAFYPKMLKKNKRGEVQTSVLLETVYMILGAIIVIMIFGIIGWLVMNVWGEDQNPTTKSFEILAEEMKNIEKNEILEIPVYTESIDENSGGNYIIIGFEKNVDYIDGRCTAEDYGSQIQFISNNNPLNMQDYNLPKPTTLCGNKPCICLYNVGVDDFKGMALKIGVSQNPLRCVKTKYSIKGSKFEIARKYIQRKGRWEMLVDWLFKDENEKITMNCGFAVLPPFGDVYIATVTQKDNDMFLCWGENCREPDSP